MLKKDFSCLEGHPFCVHTIYFLLAAAALTKYIYCMQYAFNYDICIAP